MKKPKTRSKSKNPHWGSTLDEFLGEEGTREAFQAVAIKEVLAWQLSKAMKAKGLRATALPRRWERAAARSVACSTQATAT